MMKRFAILLLGILMNASVAAAGVKIGDVAPEFKLQDLSGKQHTLSELRAKGPALLFFWSTECGYCRAMAPKLQKLHAERQANGLIVAGIDIDFNMRAQVEEFVQSRKLDFLILHGSLDNADAVEAYGVPGTPTLVVVGRDGKVVYYGHTLEGALRHLP